jgi:hypothetical protein
VVHSDKKELQKNLIRKLLSDIMALDITHQYTWKDTNCQAHPKRKEVEKCRITYHDDNFYWMVCAPKFVWLHHVEQNIGIFP